MKKMWVFSCVTGKYVAGVKLWIARTGMTCVCVRILIALELASEMQTVCDKENGLVKSAVRSAEYENKL